MARLRTNFNEDFDMSDDIGLGLQASDFRRRSDDTETTGRRWGLDYFDSNADVAYLGRNLRYQEIVKFGHGIDVPNAGRITGYEESEGRFFLEASFFSLPARQLFRASRSNGDRDNEALFERAFRGNDVIEMLGEGDDVLIGFGGNDLIRAGDGDDVLEGQAGRDRLFGEADDDLLEGDAGNDVLNGGAGSDTLEGGRGRDVKTGGGGADAFVYDGVRLGRDLIRDFEEGDVVVIDSRGVSGFEDLEVITFRGDGAVRFNRTVVAFDGMGAEEITADMFDVIV